MSRHFLSIALGLVVACGLAACKDDPKLKVTGIEPREGNATGDSTVTIKGNRFVNDGPRTIKVYFGGKPGTVRGIPNDSEIIVQAPPGKVDDVVDVVITFDPGGMKKLEKAYRYIRRGAPPTIDDLDIKKNK